MTDFIRCINWIKEGWVLTTGLGRGTSYYGKNNEEQIGRRGGNFEAKFQKAHKKTLVNHDLGVNLAYWTTAI